MRHLFGKFGQKRQIITLSGLFLINLVMFNVPWFKGSLQSITKNAPGSVIPDMMVSFDSMVVYDFLSAIGNQGRAAFQIMHATIDVTFPLVYGLLFYNIHYRFARKLSRQTKWLPLLAILPTGLDIFENIILLFLTNQFPSYCQALATILPYLTVGKFMGFAINLGYIIIHWFNHYNKKQ